MTEIIRGCGVGSLPCLGTAGRGEWAWLALEDPVYDSDRKAGQICSVWAGVVGGGQGRGVTCTAWGLASPGSPKAAREWS